MATILPHAVKQVRRIEAQLLSQISRWGYDEIILPTFEYLDVLAPGLEAELLETTYERAYFLGRACAEFAKALRPGAIDQAGEV